MSEVQVIARYTATVGHVDEVLALLAELAKASIAEPGCRRFEVFQRLDDGRRIVILARYTSREAHQAHEVAEHAQSLVKGLVPRLDSRVVETYDVPER
jgi:quinol monooxygenase YgiN